MSIIQTSLTGLTANRQRVSIAADNIANSQTVGRSSNSTEGAAPFQPNQPVATAQPNGGVRVTAQPVTPAATDIFAPDSPLADDQGFIGAPNVSLANEIVNLKQAEVAYKANLTVIERATKLDDALLDAFED